MDDGAKEAVGTARPEEQSKAEAKQKRKSAKFKLGSARKCQRIASLSSPYI
jgi:hypothetical protein